MQAGPLELILKEITSQPSALSDQLLRMREAGLAGSLATLLSRDEPLYLVGCGDSYAAALSCSKALGYPLVAAEPYELLLSPRRRIGCCVLISVSGRTSRNIEVARMVKGLHGKTIAITADPSSPLAREADEAFTIGYRAPRPLPGILSYTLNIVTLLSLFDPRYREHGLSEADVQDALASAESLAEGLSKCDMLYFVGASMGLASAIYGSAKFIEVLGCRARYQQTEEFCHTDLFSLNGSEGEAVIVIHSPGDARSGILSQKLREGGFKAFDIRVNTTESREAPVEQACRVQALAYATARRAGLQEFSFLSRKANLKLSNELIYAGR